MKKQLTEILNRARLALNDAEACSRNYGTLNYFHGKISAFQISYAIVYGLEINEMWKINDIAPEFEEMKRAINKLISECP